MRCLKDAAAVHSLCYFWKVFLATEPSGLSLFDNHQIPGAELDGLRFTDQLAGQNVCAAGVRVSKDLGLARIVEIVMYVLAGVAHAVLDADRGG